MGKFLGEHVLTAPPKGTRGATHRSSREAIYRYVDVDGSVGVTVCSSSRWRATQAPGCLVMYECGYGKVVPVLN